MEPTQQLLKWFKTNARKGMPWRAQPQGKRNPYHVWLSESMLQQTTVAAVIPYFEKFITRWPTLQQLANASEDEVLSAWAGLGYYSRARNLLKTAQFICTQSGGIFPSTHEQLIQLPGIGPYTSKAIAALSFNEPCLPIDGNIERVITRLYAIPDIMPKGHAIIAQHLDQMLLPQKSGLITEALMDLGATVCKPKNPSCEACPWDSLCKGRLEPHKYPQKAQKPTKKPLFAHAYVIYNTNNEIVLRKRPNKGLLANMLEVITTPWQTLQEFENLAQSAPSKASWTHLNATVRHIFTHIDLVTHIHAAQINDYNLKEGETWKKRSDLMSAALPKLTLKIIQAALPD